MRLSGRRALVTGATGGLGKAISIGLAREGADVACHFSVHEAVAQELGREIEALGRRSVVVRADVRDAAQVRHMVDETVQRLGGLDILVNNAGVMNTSSFLELSEEEWDRVLDTDLKGYFLVGQAAARVMADQGYGRIVNVSSTRQEQAWPGNTAYCAAKGGIWMLNRMMALELAKHGIRVNSIAPGTIETGLNRSYLSDPEIRRERVAGIPLGRLGVPDDVVDAVVLLASDGADFLVGATLMIDGGQTLW